MNPLSEILHPEKSSFSMSSPAADFLKLSINSITPSSPNKFLLKLSTFNLAQLITDIKGLTPSFVI